MRWQGHRSQVDRQRRSRRWHPLARAEEIEYDRVLFFSDAVFAIAQPVLAKYLWLLILFSSLVIRRLEPPGSNQEHATPSS